MNSETLRIAGKSLEFRRIEGAIREPAIVFLHEGLGSIALWKDFPDRVCARTGCPGVVYSRYGNGFSEVLQGPRDARYMHSEALDALPELLAALDLHRPVLYGHSDGASIALIFAAAYPESVSALVLEAPHVFVEPLSINSISEIGKVFSEGMLRERMSRYHADVDRTFFGWNDIWLSDQFRDWNITALLPKINAPMLCVQGVNDEYGTPAQIDAIADGVRGSVDRLILDRCGHSPHRDRAAYVEAAAAQWIREAISTKGVPDSAQPTANRLEIP